MLAEVRDVLRLAGGVDHDEEVIASVGDHQIVQYAAVLVREQGVALLPGTKPDHVDRHQAFQRLGRALAREAELPHMGDVEQAGVLAGVVVFLDDAAAIL
jgi:hypothetical protein